jgi:glycerol kinase
LFGVPQEILPDCMPNHHRFGTLRLAGRTLPLTVVTGDQPAALFARGEPERGIAYINIGTGAFVQALSERRVPDLLQSLLWRDPKRGTLFALEGTVNGAGAALDAAAAQFGMRPAAALRLLPASLAAAEEPPLFLNGVGGLGAPYWQPHFRSRFIGRGDAGQKLAAAVESVVFLLHANLRRMQGAGMAFRRIQVSGGLAQLDGLCQRLADLAGLPVERPEMHEATALGLAWLMDGLERAPQRTGTHFEPHDNGWLTARERRWQRALHASLA